MARPSDGYTLADGTKAIGVTTVCDQYKNNQALIRWAWNQGKAGIDFEATRDTAANIGTDVHDRVESFIHGRTHRTKLSLSEDIRKADKAFGAWSDWWRTQNIKIVETEVAQVCELHRFGGTFDALAVDGAGDLVMLDWKTSSNIYEGAIVQCAAYAHLVYANSGRMCKKMLVVNFTKKGELNLLELPITWPLGNYLPWQAFQDALRVHQHKQPLQDLLGKKVRLVR